MILRRVTLERYACFGTAAFEFRRGMNLVNGGNDSGKSLLLAALPAAFLGVEHGSRLRSWGDSLSCRVTLHFEGGEGAVRLQRDLESNQVRLEESGADGVWRETFAAAVSPAGTSPEHRDYLCHLERIFAAGRVSLLRALTDAVHSDALFTPDGRLCAGLTAPPSTPAADVPADGADAAAVARREAEIAALEAEIAADRAEFRKGEEYLTWVRKRWASPAPPAPAAKSQAGREAAAAERERNALAAELERLGVPQRLPVDLSVLFETAEGLRQELAALQQEAVPLQRRRQAVAIPSVLPALLASLAGVAPAAAAFWLQAPWLLAAAAGGGALLLACWGIYLVRAQRARAVRAGLDQELAAVEVRREAALARQKELAERFEAFELPSTPVEMVKLQQLCRRHQELIDRYCRLGAQLGNGSGTAAVDAADGNNRHLRPEELPDAEKRLAELGESLRRREERLQQLREDGQPPAHGADRIDGPRAPLTRQVLLQSAGQQLERLTGGRYRELRLNEERLQLEANQGRWASLAACSRGTAETLALALRLALCKACGTSLPLPVDGLPAHLDTQRRQAAQRALERFAVDHQLLFASCDEELHKRALRERWHIIDLNQPAPAAVGAEEEAGHAGQLHLL